MTAPVGPLATALRVLDDLIRADGVSPGDKLPTERELAARAGVSRAVVRSALDQLADRGTVVRHVGRGTFLAPAESAPAQTGPSPAEIMTARLVLEPQLMPLAVAAATGDDLEEMHRCLEGGRAATTSADFERWDTALHHSFAVATHNALLVTVSELLTSTRRGPVWGGLKQRTFTPERHRCYCGEHDAIVAGLADRDADAAQQAMRTHLRTVRATLLGEHG
ncbi:FadR/GntR family transcriptional regulator [Rhodococcus aerolatus]